MKTLLLLSLILALPAQAEVLWSSFSISGLKGNDYEVGDSKRKVITFEHASAHSWGDTFLFVDRLMSDNGDNETYGEFSPRFELMSFNDRFLKNIKLAGTIEFETFSPDNGSDSSFTHYLIGLGTDLAMPGFDFFKVNIYRRNNDNRKNNNQATVVWGLPIGPLYYDGFMDYSNKVDNKKRQMNLTSQLKYDLAPHLGLKTKLYVGAEYVYWENKFGISGVTEKNFNILVKYHF